MHRWAHQTGWARAEETGIRRLFDLFNSGLRMITKVSRESVQNITRRNY